MPGKTINTDRAPKAIGPYSQAILVNGWLFTSGQIPLDPATGKMVSGGIEAQTRRVLDNLAAVLQAAGGGFEDVVKTTIYLKDMSNFAAVNEIYASCFKGAPPARSCIQAAALPGNVDVEIETIARMTQGV